MIDPIDQVWKELVKFTKIVAKRFKEDDERMAKLEKRVEELEDKSKNVFEF